MKYTIYFMFPGLGGKRFIPKSFSEFSGIFNEIREEGFRLAIKDRDVVVNENKIAVQNTDEAVLIANILRKYFYYVEVYPEKYVRSLDDVSEYIFEKYYPKVLCYLRRLKSHIERGEYDKADAVAEKASKEALMLELRIAEAGDRVSEYTVEEVFGDIFITYLNMRVLDFYAKKHGFIELKERAYRSIGNLVNEINNALKIIMWDMSASSSR